MKYLKFLAPIGAVSIAFFFFSFIMKEEKTGYVKLQELFNQFDGKIEMEKRMQQSKWNTEIYLDSLNLQLNRMKEMVEMKSNVQLSQEILKKSKQISNINQQAYQVQKQKSEEYTQQIWNQINQYIKDYGANNRYDYIFGTEGSGVLMYGANDKDLTTEVVKFINKKYNGE